MNFYILTLFPDMVLQGLNTSVTGRAAESGLVRYHGVDIRAYTQERHGKVDDYPYGGGAGMLLQAQPVFDAHLAVMEKAGREKRVRTIYVTPQGKPFNQSMAQELADEENLIFLCGHYEGVDERVLEEIVTDYVSIGDYVLTGGELAAMVMIDAISRLVPGVLNNDYSAETETFHNDLLEYPQYTRPFEWHGRTVPEILLSGDHRKITQWRGERSRERTARIRPDLYRRFLEKEEAVGRLLKKKRDNIHIIESLRRGTADLLYSGENAVMIYDRNAGACMMTARDPEEGERLLPLIPEYAGQFVVSQEFMRKLLTDRLGVREMNHCIQACYTKREPLPVRHKDIRLLDESRLDYIREHYPLGDRSYLAERLRRKAMYGAFDGERMIGFIGTHDEGSMGLLFVEEEYRRAGVGASLESYLINRLIERDRTPYCQIFTDNQGSMELQRRLGLYFSDASIWWLAFPGNPWVQEPTDG